MNQKGGGIVSFHWRVSISILKILENNKYRTKNNVALPNWATPCINVQGGMTRTYDQRLPKQMK